MTGIRFSDVLTPSFLERELGSMPEVTERLTRSKGHADILSQMVEAALRLANERSGELPSIAVLARAMNMSRITAFYYLESPDALREAISRWTITRLTECLSSKQTDFASAQAIIAFVSQQPFALDFLVEDLLETPEGRSHPGWDALVDAMTPALSMAYSDATPDIEVHVAWMLGGASRGPRILRNCSIVACPPEQGARRFDDEWRRLGPSPVAA